MDAKTTVDMNRAELYINRELSQLEFNRRVIEQAKDEANPLLERLKFLCIASSTLDEFFEIRVAGLHHKNVYQSGPTGPDKLTPEDQLKQISRVAHELVSEQYRILNEELTPTLYKEGICFLRRSIWGKKQISWAKRFFNRELMPVLSPIGLDPSHPFPRILNKSLNFLVSLEGKDAFGRNSAIAIVQAPRALPRVIKIPNTYGQGSHDFVFLSSLIHAHVEDIFPGMKVTGCYQFRVTRDSDLFVDSEESEDLLRAIEGELRQRQYGDAVRLEVANDCPIEMTKLLQREFSLTNESIYMCNGPVNLARLMAVPAMIDRPDLKFKTFTSSLPRRLINVKDTFDAIRQGDILLHHPFQSFAPVVEFLRQAAS
ncbi:MAG TPA: RNA degradosome polyphosphate kinase, partial [Gammaproteobacteria bacterium]|nr:RNA degradosome polyphosphate kinase [Gammaproteobacteria bacterium]